MRDYPNDILSYISRPLRIFRNYSTEQIRPDIIAGLTIAVILLPQAIAFALIAELPPTMGIYTAIIAAIVAALWGSSNHVHTGPTTAISLLVMSALITSVEPGTPEYLVAAGMLAFMAGLFQVIMGFAKLGVLINFVSQSVVVGFSTGAAVLIGVKEIRYLLDIEISGNSFIQTITGLFTNFTEINPLTALLGIGIIAVIVGVRQINARYPGELIGMVLGSVLVAVFGLQAAGIETVGEIPSGLPPFTSLPLLNLDMFLELSTGALAIGAIGLVETTAIARYIATTSGQRLDSNQEFVGQGMANMVSGLFSGYACAGSFSRSAVNNESGGKTPLSAVFSGGFVLLATFTIGPLVAYLPRAALAAVLVVTAYRLIHKEQIMRILTGTRGDALIMLVTFLGTLLLQIEFAVLAGIFLSFVVYIIRTSTPRVISVLPDDNFRHFVRQPGKTQCPQLGILEILGDLYFGAATHVEQAIQEQKEMYPEQRYLLLRMYSVDNCDFSGIHMLERVVKDYREAGGDVFMMRVPPQVLKTMRSTGFYYYLGRKNFLSDDDAISYIFHRILDPAICIYECDVRAFKECQNLPKHSYPGTVSVQTNIPREEIATVSPSEVWDWLRESEPPMVVDVREPREYMRSHIPGALSIPLSSFQTEYDKLSKDGRLILVCRAGRRSTRAAYVLRKNGYAEVSMMKGGMIAWENEGLLTAVDYD